jgi:hypothetical protein
MLPHKMKVSAMFLLSAKGIEYMVKSGYLLPIAPDKSKEG